MGIFDKSDYGYEDLNRYRDFSSLKDLNEKNYGYEHKKETDSYGESLISMILDEDERY